MCELNVNGVKTRLWHRPAIRRIPALFFAGILRSLGGVKLRLALLHVLAFVFFATGLDRAGAAAPVVSNVRSVQRAGTQLVDIDYDLADPDSSALPAKNLYAAETEMTPCFRACLAGCFRQSFVSNLMRLERRNSPESVQQAAARLHTARPEATIILSARRRVATRDPTAA